jgi:hypothetical protein
MDGQKACQGLAGPTKTGLYKDSLGFGNASGALASLIQVSLPTPPGRAHYYFPQSKQNGAVPSTTMVGANKQTCVGCEETLQDTLYSLVGLRPNYFAHCCLRLDSFWRDLANSAKVSEP